MSEIEDIDVFVSGGGVAGLTATIAFAAGGFPHRLRRSRPTDHRAGHRGRGPAHHGLSAPAQAFLDRIGIWDRLAPHAMPLQVMRIVDAGGEVPEPRVAHDFNAADISDKPFGWNLPNWLLRREMVAHLADPAHGRFPPRHRHAHVLTRETEARVTLSDGARLRARLVIARTGATPPCGRRRASTCAPRATGRRRWPSP
jgi:2-octaprenyl-6-methoxyphenol hydroxylase